MSRWYWASLSMVYVIFSTAISPQNGTMLCTLQQFFTLLPLIWLYFGFMYLSCSVATRIFPSLSLSPSLAYTYSCSHPYILPYLRPSLLLAFGCAYCVSFLLCILWIFIAIVYVINILKITCYYMNTLRSRSISHIHSTQMDESSADFWICSERVGFFFCSFIPICFYFADEYATPLHKQTLFV